MPHFRELFRSSKTVTIQEATGDESSTIFQVLDRSGMSLFALGTTGMSGTTTNSNFFANVKDPAYGAVGSGSVDDYAPVQAAIAAVIAKGGGTVLLPPGIFTITANVLSTIAAQNITIIFQGAGMYNTVLRCGQAFQFNGLFGYQNGNQAQIVVRDLTIDGNYSGQGGTIPNTSGAGLVSVAYPFTNAFAAPTPWLGGPRHKFERVRFYRPCGYVFQPTNGVHLHSCLFEKCGQPELASGSTHWDILGSADGDAIVEFCTYFNSSGNYADFVWAADTSRRCRLRFVHNESWNHQIGGIYLGGDESLIAYNRLRNNVVGSGISYDPGTNAGIRGNNTIERNFLTNMTVLTNPINSAGDKIIGNVASDSPQGATAVTPAASPWTYTAAQTPEVLYLRGGTVSLVVKNGVTLATATPAAVPLNSGESVTVTYSVAPTAATDRK